MNECFKRIILDIKDIRKESIENVFYFPNEDNILEGDILIIGPENTPYQYGNYIFKLNFTKKYPYEPPVVKYLSNDGNTRFNPNFYRNGKVCLSILNTWPGEKWSACQSLRSLLLTLQITLNDNPLLNEPGISEETHPIMIHNYNKIIEYKNIEFTILYYIKNPECIPCQNEELKEIIYKKYNENKDKIMDIIHINVKKYKKEICWFSLYNMTNYVIHYKKILKYV